MNTAPAEGAHEKTLWRAFHWDVDAADGEPFSVRSVPPAELQTGGRFDAGIASVLYLGEYPEHAVAEVLREFRGRPLRAAHLRKRGFPLALVEVSVPTRVLAEVADLADPTVLQRYSLRADALALPESERAITQAISRMLHGSGLPGFRWWSAIHGAWHSTILFLDRVPLDTLGFGEPMILDAEHPSVRAAGRELRML